MNVLNSRVAAADRGEEAKRDRKHSHLDSNDDVDYLSPIGPGVRGIEESSIFVYWESVRPRQLPHSARKSPRLCTQIPSRVTAFHIYVGMMQPHPFLPCSRELNLGLCQRGRMGGPATTFHFCT